MGQFKESRVIIAFTLCILSLVSCSTNDTDNDANIDGTPAKVGININVAGETMVSRTVSGTSITDINIFIFDNDGYLIGHTYANSLTVTSTYSAAVDTRVSSKTCTICAVANYGSSISVNTLAALRIKQVSVLKDAADIASGTTSVMYGETTSAITSGSTISLTLLHLYSTYTFTITPASGITIVDYQLLHVSNTSQLYPSTSGNNPSSSYLDFSTVTTSAAAGASVTSPTYYVYENYAGTNANATTEVLRRTYHPTYASYLKVTAKTSTWVSTYYIYLGGTSDTDYTNFNIPRDYIFTYTITIKGSGASDARVDYKANIYFTDAPGITAWGNQSTNVDM